jgi:CheY-like chemotaxis protein
LPRKPASPKCVILLVEDEVIVRNFVATLLTRLKYSVLAAGDGEEALQISRGYAAPIDLLLTDVQMPRVDGLELSEKLEQERPGIKVLMMSGHVSAEIQAQSRDWGFLRKPFLPKDLTDKLREIFDAKGQPHCYEAVAAGEGAPGA